MGSGREWGRGRPGDRGGYRLQALGLESAYAPRRRVCAQREVDEGFGSPTELLDHASEITAHMVRWFR